MLEVGLTSGPFIVEGSQPPEAVIELVEQQRGPETQHTEKRGITRFRIRKLTANNIKDSIKEYVMQVLVKIRKHLS